ncbi:tripartite tricarboxylate transporter substrate binding protein [Bordetella sp. 15P40C-2]|uniref:Bug family tripartite tricarboxylate transporter substrate binding protein n=1 Tax=Bordetella sp. 15P40C-2 TaxID=2572246 RepID=UPI00132A73D1|nr:tripartite tricarboxylate transporter substrate binding protein [Bordetella sp. 15P40C-2]MVW71168.1 tripartite tricarboxylate transporter substrate binding protein [Bordetella sp. 15P40C-2]
MNRVKNPVVHHAPRKVPQAALLVAAATLTASALVPTQAAAEWPDRPMRLILPAAPGGSSDPTARLLAEELSKRLGQPVAVFNRPGAGGNVGMAEAARAEADGNTIVLSWTGPLATNMALYKSPGFDSQKDFAPIAKVGCVPNIIAVNKDLPVKDLKDYIELAKSRPKGLTYGSTGTGSSWHIAGAMIQEESGAKLVHVPYTSPGVAVTDLMSGQLDSMMPLVVMMVPYVNDGRAKGLAVMSKTRSPVLPQVPSTAELGMPEMLSDTCFALLTNAGVKPEIVAKLNQATNQVLQDPKVKERLEASGITVEGGTPEALRDYIANEVKRQAEIVKAINAKAD